MVQFGSKVPLEKGMDQKDDFIVSFELYFHCPFDQSCLEFQLVFFSLVLQFIPRLLLFQRKTKYTLPYKL